LLYRGGRVDQRRPEFAYPGLEALLEQGEEKALLAIEVGVNRSSRVAGPVRDLLDGGGVDPPSSTDPLTAGFQAEAAGRTGPDRVVMFICGDDEDAKRIVARLIEDSGFTPLDVGSLADAPPMEAPRRHGAVYGEEYRLPEAEEAVAAMRRGLAIPPAPSYV
jgi:hypothetical protein